MRVHTYLITAQLSQEAFVVHGVYRCNFPRNSQRWSVCWKRTLCINANLNSPSQWMVPFDSLSQIPNWVYLLQEYESPRIYQITSESDCPEFNFWVSAIYGAFLSVIEGKLGSLISFSVKKGLQISHIFCIKITCKISSKNLIHCRHSGNCSKLQQILSLRNLLQHGTLDSQWYLVFLSYNLHIIN